MRDVASWLTGYVTGYWQGFDFALNPTHDPDIEMELRREASSGSATGAADAPTATRPLDLPGATRPLPAVAGDESSSGLVPSSLPAIRQLALPDDIEVAGQLEALYIHRGMAQALATMVEVFRGQDMPVAASICQRAFTAQALAFDDLEDRR